MCFGNSYKESDVFSHQRFCAVINRARAWLSMCLVQWPTSTVLTECRVFRPPCLLPVSEPGSGVTCHLGLYI